MPSRKPSGVRKNPLRVVGNPVPVVGSAAPVVVTPPARTAHTPREMRQMVISEFGDWLRTQTNKQHRPFQEETILAYTNAALALSGWMAEVGLEADFTGCNTEVLNKFFRAYHSSHSQGGTNTKQRNLHHLFTWLESSYGHPHPYTSGLVRFAPVQGRLIVRLLPLIARLRHHVDVGVEDRACRVTGGLPPPMLTAHQIPAKGMAASRASAARSVTTLDSPPMTAEPREPPVRKTS
jgi:hypothetical protein